MSFGLDSEDEMENVALSNSLDASLDEMEDVTLENSLDASLDDDNEQVNSDGVGRFALWKRNIGRQSKGDETGNLCKDDAKKEATEEQNATATEETDKQQNDSAEELSKQEKPLNESGMEETPDTENIKRTERVTNTSSVPNSEEMTNVVDENDDAVPYPSSGEKNELEPIDSDKAQIISVESTIPSKDSKMEEQSVAQSSNQTEVQEKEKDVSSLKQGGGMFARFRQLQPSQSTNSTQDLQEVARALAQKSDKLDSGIDDNSTGVFSVFRKLAPSNLIETSFSQEVEEEKDNTNNTDENESGNSKEPDNDDNTGIFGRFRAKVHDSLEARQDSANKEDSDVVEAKDQLYKEGGTTGDTKEPDDDSNTGIFGRIRAKVHDSLEARLDSGNKEEADVVEAKDQPHKESGTTDNIKEPDTDGNTGIFGRFRAKVHDSLEARQDSANKEDSDVVEAKDQLHKEDGNTGSGVLDLIHRTRDDWNRRGTIHFPAMGPYSEMTVRVGKKVAEGGFSFVFHATDVDDNEIEYALKRIRVVDDETWEGCEKESIICNVLKDHKKYILPMLGLKIEDKRQTCYMLLPYMPHSLRAEVDSRLFSEERKMRDASYASSPWDEKLVLELFYHLLHGVEAMHDIGYSHRDLKLDNILLHGFDESCLKRPVLSDFGSAGPVSRPCATRKDIFEIAEEASQCTTMSYRPPELFPGALMVGHEPLNYCLVDCWSLGCTLFAILFGASPFECTFLRETGALRIGDCNQLSVLADLPRPNPETPRGKWYSEDMWDLLEFILETDRTKRPSLAMIQSRVSSLLTKETMPDEIPAIEEVTSVEDFP